MNEFDGVDSSVLKAQIRGIDKELPALEDEMWFTDDDTGEEYVDVFADYFIGDLLRRRWKIKCALAQRIGKEATLRGL